MNHDSPTLAYRTLIRCIKLKRFIILTGILLLMLAPARLQAASYYWVGGSGDWSDINHWVTTSGGNVNYTLVPTAFDDVYFDANSFTGPNQTVTLNAANYVCHNIFWLGVTNNPSFSNLNNFGLRIFGSLKLADSMNFNITGQIHFETSSLHNTIDLAGHAFNNSITFNGAGGGWDLQSPLNVRTFTLFFRQGTLNTQNHDIFCGAFFSQYTEARSLILGNSVITIGGGWTADATQFNLDAGFSTIIMSSGNATFDNRGGSLNYNNVFFTDTAGMAMLMSPVQNSVSFNKVSFRCKAYVFGDYTFNKLALLNKYYELREKDTITILQDIITAGDCNSSVYIHSSVDSSLAYISKPIGIISINYALLQDIAAVGSSPFIATNAIDLGHNPGWMITSPAALNLFWVGGTGKWDDPAHWSYTSGGPGGACVPTPLDDVYFDALSFDASGQIVTLNGYNSFCHNISWIGATNTPTLHGVYPNSLNIFGSLTNITDMVFNFSGYILFKAHDSANTITTAGHHFMNNIIFNGHHGYWEFMDDFNAGTNLVYLIKGNINTHSHTINCSSFLSAYIHERGLILGNSVVNVHGTHPNAWMFCKTHLNFDAGTSTINFTGAYGGMLNVSGDTMSFYHVNFLHTAGSSSLNTVSLTATFNRVQFFNNGSIGGENIYDTLNLNNGFYRLTANTHQTITSLMTNAGHCGLLTYIFSSDENLPAFINKTQGTIALDYVIMENIHAVGSAGFIATHSIDLGNNTGWFIPITAPRDLYWVGGNGVWNDASHWALYSGGPGGQCVPTPSDNVFFDAASFDTTGQTVYLGAFFAFCHNITWTNVQHQPTFAGLSAGTLQVYGSFILCPLMTYAFEGTLLFKAEDAGNTLHTASYNFSSQCIFNGSQGEWTLTDNFESTKSIYLMRGSLHTGNFDIQCKSFISIYPYTREFHMGSSSITLNATDATAWYAIPQNFTLDAGTSTVIIPKPNGGITNAGVGAMTFHNVFFTDSVACSEIKSQQTQCYFNRVFFRSNGNIWGLNTFDTLTFFPAKTYMLEAGLTQTINKQLDMSGNGCFPITLKSSIPGIQSIFYKSTGTVSAGFVEMHDQFATGGATFYAGNYSSDISGNAGWIFGTGPGYVFGLPDQIFICPGDTLDITTYNFIGGVSFQWQDGTMGANYAATQPGIYNVLVTYADQCYLTDTLQLMFNQPAAAILSNDTSICPGTNLLLTVAGPDHSTYNWSTGDTTASILIQPTQTNLYSVSVTNICGMATDQVLVTTYPLPTANAGMDRSVCPGTQLTLTATSIPGATFYWSTNESGASTTVAPMISGNYIVTVTDQQLCGTATDDVNVTVFPLPTADAGDDTTICQGQSLSLIAAGLPGSSWVWSTGSTHSSININPLSNATYMVTATDLHHCGIAIDTVQITVVALPTVWAGNDTMVCPGSQLSLYAEGTDASSYLWSTGEISNTISLEIITAQTIEVQAINQCGVATDEVVVGLHPLPQVFEIVSDETCQRADGSILLQGGVSYLWANGETDALHTGLISGDYNVTISNLWCSASRTINVGEVAGPTAAFTANADFLYEGQNFIFTDASENAVTWSWNFGDQHEQEGEQEVSHLYQTSGIYTVSLVVSDQNACTDTAKMQVTMEYPEIFFMPNAFTPNDDGLNETFGPSWRLPERVSNYRMSIFNRWGEEIFQTHDMQSGWDGSVKNLIASDGVYTWQIHLTEAPGATKEYVGQLVLLH